MNIAVLIQCRVDIDGLPLAFALCIVFTLYIVLTLLNAPVVCFVVNKTFKRERPRVAVGGLSSSSQLMKVLKGTNDTNMNR